MLCIDIVSGDAVVGFSDLTPFLQCSIGNSAGNHPGARLRHVKMKLNASARSILRAVVGCRPEQV